VVLPASLAVLACLAGVLVGAGAAQAEGRCGAHPWCDTSLSPLARANLVLAQMTTQDKVAAQAWQVAPGCDTIRAGSSSRSLPLQARVAQGGARCR
jgi:hypothetical protein